MAQTWRIENLGSEERDGWKRVRAEVDGREVWFESRDASLRAAPEAFAGSFLVPALFQGARLEIDAALDPVWLENTRRLVSIYHGWWGTPEEHPVHAFGGASARANGSGERRRVACFTGGADSFHSLIRFGNDFDALYFVEGFDIPLADLPRMEACERSLRHVARHFGKHVVVMRSNLREHPAFDSISYEVSHGGAILSAAHCLGSSARSLHVPSTFRYGREVPWCMRWDTDPLWSASDFEIIHGEARLGHSQKIQEIAQEPLVREHLRVCWKNLSATGNCSRCEKCLRTMLALRVAGWLDESPAFTPPADLARALAGIYRVSHSVVAIWADMLPMRMPLRLRWQLLRIIYRSWRHHYVRQWKRGLRPLRRRIARVA